MAFYSKRDQPLRHTLLQALQYVAYWLVICHISCCKIASFTWQKNNFVKTNENGGRRASHLPPHKIFIISYK